MKSLSEHQIKLYSKYVDAIKTAAISTDFEHNFNNSNFSPKKWITSLQNKVDSGLSNSDTDGGITKGLKGLGKFVINDLLLDTGSQALSAAALPIRTTLGAYDYAKGNISGKEYTGRLTDSASGAAWTAATLLSGGALKAGGKGLVKSLSRTLPTNARKIYKADKAIISQFNNKYNAAQKNILEATKANPAERAKQLQQLQAQKSKEWAQVNSTLKDPYSKYKNINNFGDAASTEFLNNQKSMPLDSFLNTYKNLKGKSLDFRKTVWKNATPEQKRAIVKYYGLYKPMTYMGYSMIPAIAGPVVSAAGMPTLGNAISSTGDAVYNTISYPYRALSDYAESNMNSVSGKALDSFTQRNNISNKFKNYLFTKGKNNQYLFNNANINALAEKLEQDSNGTLDKATARSIIRKSFAPEANITKGSIEKVWEQGASRLLNNGTPSYKYTNMASRLRNSYAQDLNTYYKGLK